MDIKKALEIKEGDCEGTVDECAKCPIGKRLYISSQGSGFDMVFSLCALLNLIDDCLTIQISA